MFLPFGIRSLAGVEALSAIIAHPSFSLDQRVLALRKLHEHIYRIPIEDTRKRFVEALISLSKDAVKDGGEVCLEVCDPRFGAYLFSQVANVYGTDPVSTEVFDSNFPPPNVPPFSNEVDDFIGFYLSFADLDPFSDVSPQTDLSKFDPPSDAFRHVLGELGHFVQLSLSKPLEKLYLYAIPESYRYALSILDGYDENKYPHLVLSLIPSFEHIEACTLLFSNPEFLHYLVSKNPDLLSRYSIFGDYVESQVIELARSILSGNPSSELGPIARASLRLGANHKGFPKSGDDRFAHIIKVFNSLRERSECPCQKKPQNKSLIKRFNPRKFFSCKILHKSLS